MAFIVSNPIIKRKIIAKVRGPVLIIGYGSIGKGFMPLLFQHIEFDYRKLTVIDPNKKALEELKKNKIKTIAKPVTKENYLEILKKVFTKSKEQGFCINLSVDVSSLDIMIECRRLGVLYIDTVVEPWKGTYDNPNLKNHERTNYSLRKSVINEKKRNPGGPTAVSCCGANPGMVSWFVKQALVNIALDLQRKNKRKNFKEPESKSEWAQLMSSLNIKGIHIAERDTQISRYKRPAGHFWNTWSVEGFLSEGLQPAELSWGTNEKWMPADAQRQSDPLAPSIFLERPGAATRVRTWCPTLGPQFGLLVTHNESISIADYFSIISENKETVKYRPTVHYAYHPCEDAWLSLDEIFSNPGYHPSLDKQHVLELKTIIEGVDELGVLLFGHERNAYWFGSQLTHEETLKLVKTQNATGLQVSSAVIAGMVWALENPKSGIVETEEMDFRRCLEIQGEYLGNVEGFYTDWNPLTNRPYLFKENIDTSDPWQFRNVLVHT